MLEGLPLRALTGSPHGSTGHQARTALVASCPKICDRTPMSPGDITRDENGTRVAEIYKVPQ
jgi:hypothetical protein